MMLANQLKQLAKDYNIFIFSATQVNASAMMDDGNFKNEATIRGSKAVADKADMAYVITRVSEKVWNTLTAGLKPAVRDGLIDPEFLKDENRPTHILDIYKMRRGRYKNVRVWTNLDLGNGRRKDLFMTTADNQPLKTSFEIYSSTAEVPIKDWKDKIC